MFDRSRSCCFTEPPLSVRADKSLFFAYELIGSRHSGKGFSSGCLSRHWFVDGCGGIRVAEGALHDRRRTCYGSSPCDLCVTSAGVYDLLLLDAQRTSYFEDGRAGEHVHEGIPFGVCFAHDCGLHRDGDRVEPEKQFETRREHCTDRFCNAGSPDCSPYVDRRACSIRRLAKASAFRHDRSVKSKKLARDVLGAHPIHSVQILSVPMIICSPGS